MCFLHGVQQRHWNVPKYVETGPVCGSAMPMLSCINFIQTIHVAFQLQIETNPHFDPKFNAFDDNPQTANQNALFVNAL